MGVLKRPLKRPEKALEENIYTIDDPEPPKTAPPEPHTEEKHHQAHKGRMRCVVNS